MPLAAFDGTADYAGTSGYSTNLAAQTSGSTDVLTDPADLAAFTGHRAVVLPIAGTSAATIDGPGNLMAGLFTEAGGTAALSYTYIPAAVSTSGDTVGATATAGAADDAVFDATTNQPVAAAAQPYAGAAGGPTQELIDHSSDNLDVSVTSDNWLIGTGGGNDVIIAHGGNNVLFAAAARTGSLAPVATTRSASTPAAAMRGTRSSISTPATGWWCGASRRRRPRCRG